MRGIFLNKREYRQIITVRTDPIMTYDGVGVKQTKKSGSLRVIFIIHTNPKHAKMTPQCTPHV